MKSIFTVRPGTVREAIESFLSAKMSGGASIGTLKTYRSDFHSLARFFDYEKPISGVHSKQIQEVVAKIAATNVSRNTVRHYTATLKSFASWCKQEGIADFDLKLYKGEEGTPQTYSKEDLQKLLKMPDLKTCDFGELRSWTAVNLLVNNGIRASTLIAIENRDVHIEDGVIYSRHMKGKKTITIPLSKELAAVLRRYMAVRKGKPEDKLICRYDGGPMTYPCLRSSIRRYNHQRGVALESIHAFRHTFARTYLVDMHGDALKLQKLLGHETLDMTKHYVKLFDADIANEFSDISPLSIIGQKKGSIKVK